MPSGCGLPTALLDYDHHCVHACALRRKLGVETPIIDGIYRVIHEEADAQAVVVEVMTRELREEVDPLVMAAAAQQAA
jgi:hypothetical protein